MIKVITYGTFDMFHFGHIRLLERAKQLGDYLIVGVTSDDFDKARGKINVQQSLSERIESVRQSGLADEIIVEEYEGQKIEDIKRLNVDIFTVGSDWVGKFDYLKEFCKVVYLDRTEGVSSSEIRTDMRKIKMGIVGEISLVNKFFEESKYVNGISIDCISAAYFNELSDELKELPNLQFKELLDRVDAVYIASHPQNHYAQIKAALKAGKHVICESPIALSEHDCTELFKLAESKHLILADLIKTAYSMAYSRLMLMLKTGIIGDIVDINATCTSIRAIDDSKESIYDNAWGSLLFWGPTAMLPVFQILGVDYGSSFIMTKLKNESKRFDTFSKITINYPNASATIKVANGVKSEGSLIISGIKGYVYVPAPWWKMDYYEVRYEDSSLNKRYFYQLDGEGIRNAIASFVRSVQNNMCSFGISKEISISISRIIDNFYNGKDVFKI